MLPLFLIALFISSIALPAAAQSTEGAEKGRFVIHLLDIATGDELFARFGHNAIIVEDREQKSELVYNFGTFDFEDPDLRIRYARGFLTYWLSVVPYSLILPFYIEEDRKMTLRTLDLTAQQAATVAERLAINARPEHREYAYRHYLDNCCTRIRNLIDDVLGGAIRKQYDKSPTGRTYRDWTHRALRGMPVISNVILFSLGPAVDHPITRWEEELVRETILRHGNYDYITGDAVWDPAILSRELPASLYLAEKPAYFGDTPWPPIGPDAPDLVTDIPAKTRFDAIRTDL